MWSVYTNQTACESNGGTWFTEYGYIDIDPVITNEQTCDSLTVPEDYSTVWAPPSWGSADQCLILGPAPDCRQVNWSRVNHLGNGRDGVPLNYTWRIPHFLENRYKLAVVRMRYEGGREAWRGREGV